MLHWEYQQNVLPVHKFYEICNNWEFICTYHTFFRIRNPFTNNIIDIEVGDALYMFSDGYVDQFGGPRQKKFMSKNFKDLLLDINTKPMEEQKEILDKTLQDWMGQVEQIDDILVMGLRI